jgi:hypothetical protein
MLLRRHAEANRRARAAAAKPVPDVPAGLSAPYRATVPELRAELERRGLDTTGKKPVLVARLEAADADAAAVIDAHTSTADETPAGDPGTEPETTEDNVDGQTPETSESGETLPGDDETPADETAGDDTTEDE